MNRSFWIQRTACAAVLWATASAGAAVIVHTVDDATLTGDAATLVDGKLALSQAKPAAAAATPATRTAKIHLATRPTTAAAATMRAAGPTTMPAGPAVALADVAQLVLREPPPPPKPVVVVPPPDPSAPQPVRRRSRGLLSALVGSVFGGSNDGAAGEPAAAPVATPATRPSGPVPWLVTLVDGDRLHGKVEGWANGTLDLRPSTGAGGATVAIPADRVAEVWTVDAATVAKARAVSHDAEGGEDVAFVRKDADAIVAVKGTALGLAGDALSFRYDGRDRRLATAKLVGVIFGGRRATPANGGLTFNVRLSDGDAVTGQWVGLDADRLTVRTAWSQTLPLAVSNVYRVVAVGGRLAYLSDLRPLRVEQVPYFGRVVPYRLDRSLAGGPIRLADGTHDKGLAVHARCALEYDLGGGFDRFRVTVGFEQPDANAGSAAVRVLADGRAIFENADARGDQPPAKLDLGVGGVHHLTLLVDFGPDRQDVQARVDWADARLLRRGATTQGVRP